MDFHSEYTDPIIGGLRVGQLGSMKYILGPNGEPITRGHHSYYLRRGTLMGQTGAHKEIVYFHEPASAICSKQDIINEANKMIDSLRWGEISCNDVADFLEKMVLPFVEEKK